MWTRGMVGHDGDAREPAAEIQKVAEGVGTAQTQSQSLAVEIECLVAILRVDEGDGGRRLQKVHLVFSWRRADVSRCIEATQCYRAGSDLSDIPRLAKTHRLRAR